MAQTTSNWWKHAPSDLTTLNKLCKHPSDDSPHETTNTTAKTTDKPVTTQEQGRTVSHCIATAEKQSIENVVDEAGAGGGGGHSSEHVEDTSSSRSAETESAESLTEASSAEVKPEVKKVPEVQIFHGNIVHATHHAPLEILYNRVIGVKKGKILFIESAEFLPELLEEYDEDENCVLQLREGSFLMPGFVDAHIHVAQYGLVGKDVDMGPVQWLSMYKVPSHKPLHDDRFVRKMARSAVTRSLRNGTTCAAYYCSALESVTRVFASIVDKLKQRSMFGLQLHMFEEHDDVHMLQLVRATDVIHYIRQKNNPLLIPSLTTMLSFPDHIERMVAEAQAKEGVIFQVDVTETDTTRQYSKKWLHLTESQIQHHHKNGIINANTVLIHCTNCSADDYELIRQGGASVVHCPNSNIALMQNVCDVRKLLEMGVTVGLGTDMSAGYSPSMLDVIRQCVHVSKMLKLSKCAMASTAHAHMSAVEELCESLDGIEEAKEIVQHFRSEATQSKICATESICTKQYRCIDYKEAFRLSTLGGAEALNLDDKIGNFQKGKEFDALIIDPFVPNSPFDVFQEQDTVSDIVEKFLLIGDDRNITHVYVAGTRVK